ncbi:MAG: hypothetical protein DI630_30870 [Gordonia sp. (in: high G+C Gram-positive bacteria)]|nr:MAG: hypothetical protein DI630_30870 [Gordonia sp. (in: high G+C Gram-positive bacteria)]
MNSHSDSKEDTNDDRQVQYRPCPALRRTARPGQPALLLELLGTFINILLSAEADADWTCHISRAPSTRSQSRFCNSNYTQAILSSAHRN